MIRRICINFIILFSSVFILGQSKPAPMRAYLIHGQGSDTREFSKLHLDPCIDTVCISLPLPVKNENIHDYAKRVAMQIDTASPFVLIGVSLGGMVSTEIADMLKPDKVIIISSAKCRKEIPFRYKFMKYVPIYRIVPARLIKMGAFMAQPLVEPDRKKEKKLFVSMLRNKNPKFLKRTTQMIVRWDRTNYSNKIIHIHGNHDHTLPLRKVKADYIIEKGSHMMVVTRADEISILINKIILTR
jgi:pimeloyl-ACP methyl ester carboxylesterase